MSGCASLEGSLSLSIPSSVFQNTSTQTTLEVISFSQPCNTGETFSSVSVELIGGGECEEATLANEQYEDISYSVVIELTTAASCSGGDGDGDAGVPLGGIVGGVLGGVALICVVGCVCIIVLILIVLVVAVLCIGTSGLLFGPKIANQSIFEGYAKSVRDIELSSASL